MLPQNELRRYVRHGVGLQTLVQGPQNGAAIVFLHGLAGNLSHFEAQQRRFSSTMRTVSIDLRGHGASDAPVLPYDLETLADDVAWLCDELELKQATIVGHSMGGNVALALAARRPDLTRAIVMIDSFIDAEPAFFEALNSAARGMREGDAANLVAGLFSELLFISSDDPALKLRILEECIRTPPHVILSAFEEHLLRSNSKAELAALSVPAAYIAADGLPPQAEYVGAINPQVLTAKTLCSGHFAPMVVPDQINAMLESFLAKNQASETVGKGPE